MLREDFNQFMPGVMSSLLIDIEADVDMKWVKAEEADLEE